MNFVTATRPFYPASELYSLGDITDHIGFIKFLKYGINYNGTSYTTAFKTTEMGRSNYASEGFILLVSMEIVKDIQYSRAFAYTYAGNLNVLENVDKLCLSFSGSELGKSEEVCFINSCFVTICSRNKVGRRGKLRVRAQATASSVVNKLSVIIR
jgi:hypothetical protein